MGPAISMSDASSIEDFLSFQNHHHQQQQQVFIYCLLACENATLDKAGMASQGTNTLA